ncbi:hypothetical protein CAAN1_17S02344 [[Candida] anglica]|uniref:NAD(P)-binding domain-containing protein n=1 Tax=[Candida] anglica TaxID=148631 RepID=A0ABP0E7D1_9ASCO
MSFKNIIVFGAHGQIGQHFLRFASASGIKSTAVIRNSEQASKITQIASGVTAKEITVDGSSVEELGAAISGHDAVVLTLGSRGKSLLQVDLDGTVKVFEAAVLAKVRRLVLISAANAENREWFSKTSLRDYYIAKHYADRILVNEFKQSLDFTILQPGALTDGASTKKFGHLGGETRSVDREDVAYAILETLNDKETYGKSIPFVNGNTDIGEFFKNVK